LLIVANQTPLTFPKSKTEDAILESNPAIGSVAITIDNNTVRVAVAEKLPFAVVCQEQNFLLEECQVIEWGGELFSKYTQELQAKGKIPIIVQTDPERIDETTLSFVKDIIALHDKENVNSFEYLLLSLDGTVDVYYTKNSYVRFMSKMPLLVQVEALETSFAKMNEIISALQEFEYVDVRFEDKVYFKKKSEPEIETEIEIETETETEIELETEPAIEESNTTEESTVQNQ
jgi:cell division septal protein FtsQ